MTHEDLFFVIVVFSCNLHSPASEQRFKMYQKQKDWEQLKLKMISASSICFCGTFMESKKRSGIGYYCKAEELSFVASQSLLNKSCLLLHFKQLFFTKITCKIL